MKAVLAQTFNASFLQLYRSKGFLLKIPMLDRSRANGYKKPSIFVDKNKQRTKLHQRSSS